MVIIIYQNINKKHSYQIQILRELPTCYTSSHMLVHCLLLVSQPSGSSSNSIKTDEELIYAKKRSV